MTQVLIVDDSRFMCEEITRHLEGSPFGAARWCRDAEEALEACAARQPDVVLMDVVLPGMDGLEATRELLGRWPELKVVIVSSLAFDDTTQSALQAGAQAVLYKPFTREQLLECLAPFGG